MAPSGERRRDGFVSLNSWLENNKEKSGEPPWDPASRQVTIRGYRGLTQGSGVFRAGQDSGRQQTEHVVRNRVQGAGFRVQGSGLRVQGSRFRVQDSGCGVEGRGFRVYGLGFGVSGKRDAAPAAVAEVRVAALYIH